VNPRLTCLLLWVLACGCGGGYECRTAADCDDGLACNGGESCSQGRCLPGTAVSCGHGFTCREPRGECACAAGYLPDGDACRPDHCEVPQGPVLAVVAQGTEIVFTTTRDYLLQVGQAEPGDSLPAQWRDGGRVTIAADLLPARLRLFARMRFTDCRQEMFLADYRVTEAYPGPAGSPTSTALAADDPAIMAWATGFVEPVEYGEDVDPQWRTPEKALGPAEGNSDGVVSLGRGGSLTVTFATPITDGPGYDLAVFENALDDGFLELARVAVSSDGRHFVEFDCASLTPGPVGAFERLDTTRIGSLAGKYRAGFGTPFDLAVLRNKPQVLSGQVQLNRITQVRIIDVVGDGSQRDSFGHPLYDPWPTRQSAGFDLDAVAVLHQADGG